jgi:IS30 family transposase
MSKIFRHFSFEERKRIERGLTQQKSLRRIAGVLERSVSSISDEVRRNSVRGRYDALKAQHKARVKRKYSKTQCLKVAEDLSLRIYVEEQIKNNQSPEGISGRLERIDIHRHYASTKAIYKFVKSPYGRQIEKHLYSRAVKKRGGPKRNTPVAIDGRTMIDKRPKTIEKRKIFGHFEGDFIESGKDGKGSLLVLVERKTRYPFLKYLDDRDTETVNSAVRELLWGIPVKTLTIDNDISFQKHEKLSRLIGADIFFCHPQSPHEKGTVENRNKAIRRYIPKRSDLSTYTNTYIHEVETTLRNCFMKCLGYQTPYEAFQKELQKTKITTAAWYHENTITT